MMVRKERERIEFERDGNRGMRMGGVDLYLLCRVCKKNCPAKLVIDCYIKYEAGRLIGCK